MATANVHNVVAGSDAERLVKKWVEEALGKLDPDGTIDVEVAGLDTPLAGGTGEASAGPEGLWIHPSIIFDALTVPGQDLRFGFIISEEVAHYVLGLHDVPHEGIAQFFQEFYATWFQVTEFLRNGRIPASRVTVTPIRDDDKLIYGLGKHAGAALAGSARNQHELERWLNRKPPDDENVELVRFAQRRLRAPLSPEDVAAAYNEWLARGVD